MNAWASTLGAPRLGLRAGRRARDRPVPREALQHRAAAAAEAVRAVMAFRSASGSASRPLRGASRRRGGALILVGPRPRERSAAALALAMSFGIVAFAGAAIARSEGTRVGRGAEASVLVLAVTGTGHPRGPEVVFAARHHRVARVPPGRAVLAGQVARRARRARQGLSRRTSPRAGIEPRVLCGRSILRQRAVGRATVTRRPELTTACEDGARERGQQEGAHGSSYALGARGVCGCLSLM